MRGLNKPEGLLDFLTLSSSKGPSFHRPQNSFFMKKNLWPGGKSAISPTSS
jgi:hypothetical protein